MTRRGFSEALFMQRDCRSLSVDFIAQLVQRGLHYHLVIAALSVSRGGQNDDSTAANRPSCICYKIALNLDNMPDCSLCVDVLSNRRLKIYQKLSYCCCCCCYCEQITGRRKIDNQAMFLSELHRRTNCQNYFKRSDRKNSQAPVIFDGRTASFFKLNQPQN